jgi:hypothetical protein
MKRSPDMVRMESLLRASKLVADGFLGTDTRPVEDLIAADAAALEATGRTLAEVCARLREISDAARPGLETSVPVGKNLEARVVEARGRIPCPWAHAGRYFKTVTEARRTDTGRTARWSDLSVHMIEAHGFFQGRGSAFRLDPAELVSIIFQH